MKGNYLLTEVSRSYSPFIPDVLPSAYKFPVSSTLTIEPKIERSNNSMETSNETTALRNQPLLNLINPGLANPINAPRASLHSAQLLDLSTRMTTALYFSQMLKPFPWQISAQ